MSQTTLIWFRQDLRIADNPALWHACQNADKIIALYILEEEHEFAPGGAQRWWLHHSLYQLQTTLAKYNVPLTFKRGNPLTILSDLVKKHDINSVFWNRCYEPHHIEIAKNCKTRLQESGVEVHSFNGSLLFEPWEIKNNSGGFFKVFTPFWRCCLRTLQERPLYKIPKFPQGISCNSETLNDLNLLPTQPDWSGGLKETWEVGEAGAHKRFKEFMRHRLQNYREARDVPALDSTSKLSPHLHFGEISPAQILSQIRTLEHKTPGINSNAEHFLREIGWREFSYHLLYHFPTLPSENFRPDFNHFGWLNDPNDLQKWQRGETGYPIVDAGMRELWHTGYMHNRVRMIVASFLTKHLLIHWTQGEKWFWDTLVDADLANNAASWQWTAGSGADAAPYFRIFNPVLQGEKFDPRGEYVAKWCDNLRACPPKYIHRPWDAPELVLKTAGIELGKTYPHPMIDHQTARLRALSHYHEMRNPLKT